MISDLHLKGNELLVFALIHGYTKGGSNTCRASLNYIANWIQTGKSAVIKAINNLEEAGYVNRHEYLEGRVKCVEYTTNYEALLLRSAQGEYISLETVKNASKMQRGVKMTPQQSAFHEGCQNDTGVKMTTKGCQNDNGRGVKIAPNNIIDNIIYYYSSRTREEQEEEKKNSLKFSSLEMRPIRPLRSRGSSRITRHADGRRPRAWSMTLRRSVALSQCSGSSGSLRRSAARRSSSGPLRTSTMRRGREALMGGTFCWIHA